MPLRHSPQHNLLLALDNGINAVFYVAPRFYTMDQFNVAYASNSVRDHSFFIRPQDIGPLDHQDHCVSYDETGHFVCSDDPRRIDAYDRNRLTNLLDHRLDAQRLPFGEGPVDQAITLASSIARRHRRLVTAQSERKGTRHDLPVSHRKLMELADLAVTHFDAQLFIFQRRAIVPS